VPHDHDIHVGFIVDRFGIRFKLVDVAKVRRRLVVGLPGLKGRRVVAFSRTKLFSGWGSKRGGRRGKLLGRAIRAIQPGY
jgi:hypothetical protein